MCKFSYSITGSTGTIGSEITNRLLKDGEEVRPITTKYVSNLILEKGLTAQINMKNLEIDSIQPCAHHCLIFSHRLRSLEENPALAIATELILTKAIIDNIIEKTKTLNIIWIGSCTGSQFHRLSKEGYHYVKDLQKSISRYSGMHNKNIISNTIELSIFEKYKKPQQTNEYIDYVNQVKGHYDASKLASYKELTHAIKYLAHPSVGHNGDCFRLDMGLGKMQVW